MTGNTRDTNGRFFRGALLMDNLLGLADQVWLAGFWLNSGLQGEARANGKLDTSSLALHYLHGSRVRFTGCCGCGAACVGRCW
ncbi:AraC family transcriptional regulator [Raoultella ornithinolytica]|nr:AraC family transcriptional regulator [Raoultella ornithinolytica]